MAASTFFTPLAAAGGTVGVLMLRKGCDTTAPTPTTGQIWPRGNP